jgi:hypothetical protein
MASHPRRTTLRVDADGVKSVEARGVRIVLRVFAVVVGLVSLAVVVAVVAIRLAPARQPTEATSQAPAAPPDVQARTQPAAPPAPAADRPKVVPRRKQSADPAKPAEGEDPDATFTLPKPGERTGIAVFPPPGTKPVKRGIIVPEDFELPPGYVRHYQTTDDGKQLPAVLMFHPDFEFVDERGTPVPLPEDRIVPPEMAPPGMPIQMLEVRDPKAPPGTAP